MIDLGINLFQEIAALGGGGGGYSISNSLRFNDNDSAYLSRTPSVAGDRKTWTWSGWVKRGNLGVSQNIFGASNGSTTQFYSLIGSTDTLSILNYIGATQLVLTTTQVFRDPSGWYHLVLSVDTTQTTSSDRVKLYVNGVQVTEFSTETYPSQDYDTTVNTTVAHALGREEFADNQYLDGYIAEVNFIDGQALTADDFGEINADTGEWSPKRYAGTYGTNGFYLPFDGNANDSSGNGNNWTENNLASTDFMIDTCTNNFSVWNALDATNVALSQGNLLPIPSVDWYGVGSTFVINSGKYYAEFCSQPSGTGLIYQHLGVAGLGLASYLTISQSPTAMYNYSGSIAVSGSVVQTVASSASGGEIIGIALDLDGNTITFYKNGVLLGTPQSLPANTTGGWIFKYNAGAGRYSVANFGQDSSFAGIKTRQGNTDANGKGDFYYAPPAGYLALCTDNLPAPAIEQPETQFNVVTYTGNSADRNIDLGFEADFVWIKRREIASQNCLFDSVRGNGQFLFSNLTNAEFNGVNDGIHFDYANGFNIDVGSNVSYYNETGGTYVAWCWKAGGTAVTNTDGAITSQVSANVDAGFSIVNWTATSNGYTVGHGLSSAPELIITKSRALTTNWWTFTTLIDGSVDFLGLNLTNAKADDSIGLSAPTSTVFSMHSGYTSTPTDVIAYCFHSVEGFSKVGSYVGNGSADGPFVYTGFKPAFIMYKRATGGTGNWNIADNMREGYNWDNPSLYPNLSNAESGGSSLDILSNGFKINNAVAGSDHNASGSTYIYMAFAEHPFNYALGR